MYDQNPTPHPDVVAELFSGLEHELQQRNIKVEFHPLAGVRKLLARGRENAESLQLEGLSESRTDLRPATSAE